MGRTGSGTNKTCRKQLSIRRKIRPMWTKRLGGSLRMFCPVEWYEKSSLSRAEKTRLYVSARLPFGNTLDQMDYYHRGSLKLMLKDVKGIDAVCHRSPIWTDVLRSAITFEEAYEKLLCRISLKGKLSVKSTTGPAQQWKYLWCGSGPSNTVDGGEGMSASFPSRRCEATISTNSKANCSLWQKSCLKHQANSRGQYQ